MSDVIEQRNARRFAIALPLKISHAQLGDISCVTRDVSSSGVYFYVESDRWEKESSVEFVLQLPSEVTLVEPVNVLCHGRIVRVEGNQGTIGIAVRIERFDFLANG